MAISGVVASCAFTASAWAMAVAMIWQIV